MTEVKAYNNNFNRTPDSDTVQPCIDVIEKSPKVFCRFSLKSHQQQGSGFINSWIQF